MNKLSWLGRSFMLSSRFTLARKHFEFKHYDSLQLPSSVYVHTAYTEEGSCKLLELNVRWLLCVLLGTGIPDLMSRAHNAAVERRRTLEGLQREVLQAD